MTTNFDKISIQSIQFETDSAMVHVCGEAMQDNFRFHTNWLLDFSDLNLILAKMRQQLDDVVFEQLFEQFELGNGNTYYSFDAQKLTGGQIWLEDVFFTRQPKQIRA